MALSSIIQKVQSFDCPLVEVTGGEPLHQSNSLVLLTQLCETGFQVMLETSGMHDISVVDPRVAIIMDVKCPGSGMSDRMHWPNLQQLKAKDEVKFVIQDREDYEWARDVIKRYSLHEHCPVLFSAVFGTLNIRSLAEWVLHDRLPVRLQHQLHKIIWDPDTRGV